MVVLVKNPTMMVDRVARKQGDLVAATDISVTTRWEEDHGEKMGSGPRGIRVPSGSTVGSG